MGQRYAVTGNMTTVGSSDEFSAEIIGGTAAIIRVYHIMMACDAAAPIDEMSVHSVFSLTAGGTSTPVTPSPFNKFDKPVAKSAAGENHSVGPTTEGIALIEVPVHQRATMQWQVPIEGALQSSLLADDGWGFATRSPTYVLAAKSTIHFEE